MTDAPATIEITTQDGVSIAATRYEPKGGALSGQLLISPAMGVPQTFYRHLAAWLADQGFRVVTFDYRGTGRSLHGSMADVETDLVTWIVEDGGAVLDYLYELDPNLPVTWLGHSLGGQLLPMLRNGARVTRFVNVAAGSGYWAQNAWVLRWRVLFFWWLFVPISNLLFGYFAGKRLGMVGDLPKGAIIQWRRWCMHRDYALGSDPERFRAPLQAFEGDLTSFWLADDEILTEASIRTLTDQLVSGNVEVVRLAPRDFGLKRIGHMGFFRPNVGEKLWNTELMPRLARRG